MTWQWHVTLPKDFLSENWIVYNIYLKPITFLNEWITKWSIENPKYSADIQFLH